MYGRFWVFTEVLYAGSWLLIRSGEDCNKKLLDLTTSGPLHRKHSPFCSCHFSPNMMWRFVSSRVLIGFTVVCSEPLPAEVEGFPSAYDVIPKSYRLLGLLVNRGNVVEIEPDEREAILDVGVVPSVFRATSRSQQVYRTANSA